VERKKIKLLTNLKMPKKWAYIIIFTVFVVVVYSGWEIYKAFEQEKDVEGYERYATKISREFDVSLLDDLEEMQSNVPIDKEDIAPK
jgi:hypothetical protein